MPFSSVLGAQSVVKPGVCTSTTRPASPYDGQVVYLTDTDQTLVWDGTAWTVLAPIAGGRNLLINGDFKVWQRGTAVQANAGQGAYAADRWCGSHQFQNSRTQRTAISSPPSGLLSQYALRSSSSTTAQVANGTRMRIAQKVESLNSYRLRGQQVTLSFWVRFSNATVSSVSNSGGGGTSNYYDFNYSIGSYTSTTDSATNTSAADSASLGTLVNGSLPTSWTKYTLTGTISSTANNVDVVFGFSGLGSTTSADTEWFELAQIQLEAGSVATPFEFEDYQATLAKCQRYYYRLSAANGLGVYTLFGIGHGDTTTNVEGLIQLPVQMRTAPNSIDTTGTASNYAIYGAAVVTPCTSIPVFGSSNSNLLTQGVSFRATGAATVGRAYQMLANNNNVAYVGYSAEL